MVKIFNLRLKDDLIDRIKQEAQNRGLTQKDLMIKALEHFFTCRKAQIEPSMREIINAYENTYCSKCSQKIPIGQNCLWGKDEKGKTIYICLGCQIEGIGDKALIKKHQKLKQIERLIKAYKNQLDNLAIQFEESDHLQKSNEVFDMLIYAHKLIMKFFSDMAILNNQKEEELLTQIINYLRQYLSYIKDFQTFYAKKVSSKALKRRV